MNSTMFLLLSISYVFISFTGLTSRKMRPPYYFLLLIHLIIIYAIVGPLIGQWVTLPLVLISVFIIYWGSHRNIWETIFSLMGYLIGTLANHMCTVPLSALGIPASELQSKYLIPFLLTVTLLTATLLFFIKKYFLNTKLNILQNCPQKLQYLFLSQLLICVALFTVNFVYGESIGYPTEVLSMNGSIITLFTLFTMFLLYSLYLLLQDNYELKLHQKEYELMNDYTKRMESFYEDIRVFRHDYKNILSTLNYYIEENRFEELQTYFQEKILPSGEMLSSDTFSISKLQLIAIPAIKSILYAKLLSVLNKGITFTLEITEPLTEIYMDELDLSRILGILLDNSIEAAHLTEDKQLTIAIVITDESILFSFINSCLPPTAPLNTFVEYGYTTKKGHDGLGLYTVQNIVNSLNNVSFSMQYDGLFRQVLEIMKL